MSNPIAKAAPFFGALPTDETNYERFERLAREERDKFADDPRFAAMERLTSLASTPLKDISLAALAASEARMVPGWMEGRLKSTAAAAVAAAAFPENKVHLKMTGISEAIAERGRLLEPLNAHALKAAGWDEREDDGSVGSIIRKSMTETTAAMAEAAAKRHDWMKDLDVSAAAFVGGLKANKFESADWRMPEMSSRAPHSFTGLGYRSPPREEITIVVNVQARDGLMFDDINWRAGSRAKN